MAITELSNQISGSAPMVRNSKKYRQPEKNIRERLASEKRSNTADPQDKSHADKTKASVPGEGIQNRKILLVSGTLSKRSKLEKALKDGGYEVTSMATSRDALSYLQSSSSCDLVMFENASDTTPTAFCNSFIKPEFEHLHIPLVLVSDRFDADQAVDCLKSGARDYISGPHLEEHRVLLARLAALLRSSHRNIISRSGDRSKVIIDELLIDPIKYCAYINDKVVNLTKMQFELLLTLARKPGRVFSHVQLREIIAKQGGDPDERTVKSHIFHLRKRLGTFGNRIRTVRGLGYTIN